MRFSPKDTWRVKKSIKDFVTSRGVSTADTWLIDEESIGFIDSKVRPVVSFLNSKNVKTYYSCQGHPRRKYTLDDGRTIYGHSYIAYEVNDKISDVFESSGFRVDRDTFVTDINEKVIRCHYAEFKPKDTEHIKYMWENVLMKLKEKI